MAEPLFEFFDMPRELRDLVYHYLWEDHPDITTPYSNRRTELRYDQNIDECRTKTYSHNNPFPPWLPVSKAFLYEATAAFNERAEWTWHPATRTRGAHSTLFGPTASKVVTLRFGELASVTRCQMSTDKAQALSNHHRLIAEDMLACIQEQHLHLFFDLREYDDPLTLSSFAKVDVDIFKPFRYVQMGDLVIYLENDEDVMENLKEKQEAQLKQGYERIAKMILGTDTPKCCMEKHWKDRSGGGYYWLQYKKPDHWLQHKKGDQVPSA